MINQKRGVIPIERKTSGFIYFSYVVDPKLEYCALI